DRRYQYQDRETDLTSGRRNPRSEPASDLAVTRPEPTPQPAKNDDAVDFDTIYRLHGRAIARWIVRLGGPAVVVEDLLQEVFLAVSRQLPGFRGDAKLTTWLFS